MLAAIAPGRSRITGFATSDDCHATLDCLSRLGVGISTEHGELLIDGVGLNGFEPTRTPVLLDCRNSGSTIRMLSGILAAQTFTTTIDGDASLRRRPMKRILDPLRAMGAVVTATDGGLPPLTIRGARLSPIRHVSRTASAQVKTCVLFAGLFARGETSFVEPVRSRDHTEIMLPEFGARISEEDGAQGHEVALTGPAELNPVDYQIPGDTSSASVLIGAGAIVPGSELVVSNVCLNPTRLGFVDVLKAMGADISIANAHRRHGEVVGDLTVRGCLLKTGRAGTVVEGDSVATLIDELPILAVAATQAEGRLDVRGAGELRVKESDRIRMIVDGLRLMGAAVDETEDGFGLAGPQRLAGARVRTNGDHRIAMAFTVAGLVAEGTTEIDDADCVEVSFPEFVERLSSVTLEGCIGVVE
jgi:3-phosphoshikimate 1-carboxyvinyltransferase